MGKKVPEDSIGERCPRAPVSRSRIPASVTRLGRWSIRANLSVCLLLLSAAACSQTVSPRLDYGVTMPSLAGQTLSGKWMDLPTVAAGKPAVVIFSFSRAAGRDAQNWTEHLSRDEPRLSIYTVIFLESVPRILRGAALAGIRSGMPSALQERTIPLYRDEDLWKQRLQVVTESHACITLLRPDGKIQWMSWESFGEARYSELKKQIQALR
jgi:hypothetical protein